MMLIAYKRMPVWNRETVPTEITHKHNTKVGTWGKIKVLKGQLQFEAISDDNEITSVTIYDAKSDIPMVEPQAWHRVTLLTEDTEFFLEFFCKEEDYLAKKYGYTRTHSEVIEALQTITQPCKVLDLGCGRGRNALYLAKKGFDVTAVDQNLPSLEILQEVMTIKTWTFRLVLMTSTPPACVKPMIGLSRQWFSCPCKETECQLLFIICRREPT